MNKEIRKQANDEPKQANDEPKQANAELTESELTQVTGGLLADHMNSEPLDDGASVITDETTTKPKKPIIAVW